jgi:hypothetical protein
MNPFAAFAANMKAYEAMTSEPVNEAEGNYVLYGDNRITAVVSNFMVRQVLVNGGFSPMLVAEAIIQKDAVPEGAVFKTGQNITAVQVGGESHECQIQAVDGDFTEFRLQLVDVNEGA